MSKPSETDKRYDRYAEIFDNPVDHEVLERGNRVLHHEFMENFAQYVSVPRVRDLADEAQQESLRRTEGDPARRAAELERQRDWSPARHPIRAKRQGRSR
jgi:hypothetical protein